MDFAVYSQRLELDFDFATQSLKGRTAITIEPKIPDLKAVRFNARQCLVKKVTVQGLHAGFTYRDPYDALRLQPSATVYQHHIAKDKLEDLLYLTGGPPEDSLEVIFPRGVKIQQTEVVAPTRQINGVIDGDDALESPVAKTAVESLASYSMLEVGIEFEVKAFRDGLHFVGVQHGDERYPHLYTCNSDLPGSACCIFPCVDTSSSRHEWDISIRYPRTLGDAVRKPAKEATSLPNGRVKPPNGMTNGTDHNATDEPIMPLNKEDAALDMRVVCSGNLTDDVVDPNDPTRKTASFRVDEPIAARHVGIAIGPFEHVDLSEFRESDQDEKLGTHAVRVHGFCLPGRADELRNTCMPLAAAVDFFSTNYVAYPYPNHKVCFVDDLARGVADSASLSICSSRLLIPEDILDPLYDATRELLRGLAAQWVGILVFPRNPQDFWITVGGAYFMADHYGSQLWGKNEHRYRLKSAANQVIEQDIRRPSLHDLGHHVNDIPGWLEFMKLKAPVVLQILHQRLVKASGRNGVNRIFWRVLTNTKTEQLSDGAISTPAFLRICEKVGHAKLDVFFNQWVYGAGYPIFLINQKFNKKKLCVEMMIKQTQSDQQNQTDFNAPQGAQQSSEQITAQTFRRTAREYQQDVVPPTVQRVFNGPMTIRIHEADGTPYEHIVEIKDAITRIEIPYNTKYKRLKRSRRQKERQAASTGTNPSGDNQDETLLYCLGDVLQSTEEFRDWRLMDWPEEEEAKMSQESYEWIRVDKDFEWISKTYFIQPGYMYVSQLQQDNDVVAQIEALEWMSTQRGTPLMATFLVRTLMDSRYFYGVRTMAADLLASCGPDVGFFHLEKAFKTFFCFPDSPMTRSNDFSDRPSYLIQCAIPQAMAKIRDTSGRVPFDIRQFFVDKLKFNDNSNNEYSDCFYVSTLMSCLAESLIARGQKSDEFTLGSTEDEEMRWRDVQFQKMAVHELERYRRIDEWIPSFQNTYSVTSLDCTLRLMESRTIPKKGTDFLLFSQPGNADTIRVKAFEGLARIGLLANPSVLGYCFVSLATEASPFFRQQLWNGIWQGLGVAIFAEQARDEAPAPQMNGTLVVEHASTVNRHEAARRTQSAAGALEALKSALSSFDALPETLLMALTSTSIGASDFVELLDLCEVLFEPEDRLIVSLRYPRYWRCEHLGEGKLRFFRGGRPRTKKRDQAPPEFKLPRAPTIKLTSSLQRDAFPDLKRRRESATADQIAQPHPMIRIKQKQQDATPTPAAPPPVPRTVKLSSPLPPLPPTPAAQPVQRPPAPQQPAKRSLIVKLKIGQGIKREQTSSTISSATAGSPSASQSTLSHVPPAPTSQASQSQDSGPASSPPAPPSAQGQEKRPMLKLKFGSSKKGS